MIFTEFQNFSSLQFIGNYDYTVVMATGFQNFSSLQFIYDLRHSCATILCESNVNVKDIQMFLGHSSAKTTMDIYVHQMNKSNLSTVSIINEKIGI